MNVPSGALEVSRLRKKIGSAFELRADFRIAAGERAVLAGPSGSGKTTLLRVIAGLEELGSGEGQVRVGGEDLTQLPVHRRRVGLVFQDQALFPGMNVLENAAFGLRMLGKGKSEREAEALAWLRRVGMESHRDRSIAMLSGGERQRLAFVRALIPRPRVLLLDEPFSALDPELRHEMRQMLLELLSVRSPGLSLAVDPPLAPPMILVTHDPEDLEAIATVRLELKVEEQGRVRTLERAER